MDAGIRSRLGLIMGIVILVADLLWLSGSFFHYGGAYTGVPYRNFTHLNSTYPSGPVGNFAGRAGGPAGAGYLNFVYGTVILVADIIWLCLGITAPKHTGKKR